MDVEELELDAKSTAAKHVSNMLQRADQLEKVEQYKRRVVRKKASVEAMLKTAMQSQLDGVRTGLTQLQTAFQDIHELKAGLSEIEEQFSMVPKLQSKLQDIREESLKHTQYAAAMENLKHIFTVPECVERTRNWIKDGKLLFAHQGLTHLENSRDDLLFELHRLPNQSPLDSNMLKQYFADVVLLSNELGEQLWIILQKTLDAVRTEPTAVVTALRIIEREEKSDELCEERFKTSGFMPTGRPKRWRRKAIDIIEAVVRTRIDTLPLCDRSDDKMWLVLYLERLRLLIIDDLVVVKKMCVPCFPPNYDIFNKFVKFYHGSVAKRLRELSVRLKDNEYVTLLNWLNVYESAELMSHPDLNVEVKKIDKLLDRPTVDALIDRYCNNIDSKFQSWMENTLKSDFQDWMRNVEPEQTSEGFFHTPVPVILFQMIDQHLQLAKTVNQDLVNRLMNVSMRKALSFRYKYREQIINYKLQHFKDRSLQPYFTHYMIAIINNCSQFVDLTQQLRNKYHRAVNPSATANNDLDKESLSVLKAYVDLRDESVSLMLDELFLDLDSHLQELFTRKWMSSPDPVDTICVTLEDYCSDYTRLNKKNFMVAMKHCQDRVAANYIKLMLVRKINLKNYEERRDFADKVIHESQQLKALFKRVANVPGAIESPFEPLSLMVEVVKLKDSNMVSLEILGLKKCYQDVTVEQLTALLGLRSDIGRGDAQQLVLDVIPDDAGERKTSNPDRSSIFSKISLT